MNILSLIQYTMMKTPYTASYLPTLVKAPIKHHPSPTT